MIMQIKLIIVDNYLKNTTVEIIQEYQINLKTKKNER